MREVYIVDCGRTAVGSFCGALGSVDPVSQAEAVIRAILERNSLSGEVIDETILGNVLQAGFGQNIARQAAVRAGIPVEKTAATINMLCGSGLKSVIQGVQGIMNDDADVVMAGGTESMSMAPYMIPRARTGLRMGDAAFIDSLLGDGLLDAFDHYHMGVTAENIAGKYGISREEQDIFACESQNKAEQAQVKGLFSDEIIPVMVPNGRKEPIRFVEDEYIRKSVTIEGLARLAPAFKKGGTVTAGNASGINDGAACALIASPRGLERMKAEPMARIVSWGYAGVDPSVMGLGPIPATRTALERAGWSVDDLELIEANEAFAVQALAVSRELEWDMERVNVNGGAIALGHPVGASGCRILVTLLYEMKRRQARRGLATLCVGGGQGVSLCVEMM